MSSSPDENHKKEPSACHVFALLKEMVLVVPLFTHPLFSSWEGMPRQRSPP